MDFNEYQRLSRQTAIYPDLGRNFTYPALGLAGETGEVCEKIKKILRDRQGAVDDALRADLSKELGDVLWYLAQLATELDLSLHDVAKGNIDKLFSRRARAQLQGSGDHR